MPYQTLITPTELIPHLTDPTWVIIDCRFDLTDTAAGHRQYEEAHISGAVYAHLDHDLSGPIMPGETGRHPLPTINTLSETVSNWGIDSTTQVVAYDAKGGAIAARLWWMLHWLGHEAVAVLDGGWQRWQQEEHPTRSGVELPTRRQFTPQPRSEYLATLSEVKARYFEVDFALFDARAEPRYRGEVEPLDPIAGHIPGAISAPFAENLTDEKQFHPSETLQSRFKALLGNTPPEKAVFYCGSGVTAAHNLLAMRHAGLGMARLYAGSWSEWITQSNCPVETS